MGNHKSIINNLSSNVHAATSTRTSLASTSLTSSSSSASSSSSSSASTPNTKSNSKRLSKSKKSKLKLITLNNKDTVDSTNNKTSKKLNTLKKSLRSKLNSITQEHDNQPSDLDNNNNKENKQSLDNNLNINSNNTNNNLINDLSEYTTINEYTTNESIYNLINNNNNNSNQISNLNKLDNYFSIDDDSTTTTTTTTATNINIQRNNTTTTTSSLKAIANNRSSLQIPMTNNDSNNLYSKIEFNNRKSNALKLPPFKKPKQINSILANYQLSNLSQPIAKILNKLTKHDFSSNSKSKYFKQQQHQQHQVPIKNFDPNEELYATKNNDLFNPPSIQPPPPPAPLPSSICQDSLNFYTEMSESINSNMSKIKIETDDNYQSVHDQYDYISSSTTSKYDDLIRTNSIKLNKTCQLTNLPPPLPPASTQPSRNHVISQIYTTIEPLSINNQVYYSFTSENASVCSDALLNHNLQNQLSSSSSLFSSTNSSLALNSRNEKISFKPNILGDLSGGGHENLSNLFSTSSVSTTSSCATTSSNTNSNTNVKKPNLDENFNLNSDSIVQI